MRQHLGCRGPKRSFIYQACLTPRERGHRLKSRAEPSEQFPQTPHCASRVARGDSVSSRERDTSFEGDGAQRTVCVGIHDASL